MTVVCSIDFDRAKLTSEVRATYARVALEQEGSFHFHRGAEYAARQLGYDLTTLQA